MSIIGLVLGHNPVIKLASSSKSTAQTALISRPDAALERLGKRKEYTPAPPEPAKKKEEPKAEEAVAEEAAAEENASEEEAAETTEETASE